MPTHSFFFSYANADRVKDPDGNIAKFHGHLNDAVTGFGAEEGFFDKQGIGAGDAWERSLRDALRTTNVLVAMYSPRYFKSKYCRWEWQTFYDHYQARLNRSESAQSMILPIRWLVSPEPLPEKFEQFQFPHEFPKNVEDLSQLMRVRKHRERYEQFVRDVAMRLANMVRQVGNVERSVSAVVPNIHETATSPVDGAEIGEEKGTQHVRCVLVTGTRDEILLPRQFKDCYGSHPERRDWRSFFPTEERSISAIVEDVARDEGREIRYLGPGPNLLADLRAAERRNNIVVVVVDPWSLSIAQWQQFVERFDETLLKNCGVVVVWNGQDPDNTPHSQGLYKDVVRQQFQRHIQVTSTFFRESVTSVPEFKQALIDAFQKIRATLVGDGKAAVIKEGMTERQPVVNSSSVHASS